MGKTTTAVNLAAGLADKGQRVLLIDADPQGNATTGVGIDKTNVTATLFEVFSSLVDNPEDKDAVKQAIVDVKPNLDVIPATLDLAGAEAVLLNAVGKEMILREAIDQVRKDYKWIIIDAPPSLGLITVNVLAAVDEVVVPMQCEFYALEGISHLLKTIDRVKRRINPELSIGKVLLTMYDPRNNLTHSVQTEVEEYFGSKLSRVRIPRNVRLSEAPSFGAPALDLFPESKGAIAYQDLVSEVLEECAVH